jgi:type VI secretion system lysozyme-like protein
MANERSLFEKLIDEDTEIKFEKNPKRFRSFADLQRSIAEDLSLLLNTRVATFWKNNYSKSAIPFAYGVNLIGSVIAENPAEMQQVASEIDGVIRQFEPRLINAKSCVQAMEADPCALYVTIDANVIFEDRKTPFSFPVVINLQ